MRKCFPLLLAALLAAFSLAGCGKEPEKEFDWSKFPNYVEDIDSLKYSFEDEQIRTPFWTGNVIYNETVMLVDAGQGAVGKLLYAPVKILSVRDFSLEIEYAEGRDYTVEGNVIKRVEGSSIPFLTQENLEGKNIPEPYRRVDQITNQLTDYMMMPGNVIYTESPLLYGNQLSVSYVYDVLTADLSCFPQYDGAALPKFSAKLAAREPVKIVGIGDSVLEGCSSSGTFNRPPFMDNFMTLAAKELSGLTGAEVVLDNQSLGGMTSAWGSAPAQINKIVAAAPDVLFVHFGINDNGAGISPNAYRDNIELLLLSVREKLPDCEFVFFTALSPNMAAYDSGRFEDYWKKAGNIADTMGGVKIIDMYSMSAELLKTKKYFDITGNGINHVNDYSARLYLMSILSTFVTF